MHIFENKTKTSADAQVHKSNSDSKINRLPVVINLHTQCKKRVKLSFHLFHNIFAFNQAYLFHSFLSHLVLDQPVICFSPASPRKIHTWAEKMSYQELL